MNKDTLARRALLLGTVMLGLGVLFGAFGAHGLKSIVSPDKLVTFETGVRHQFYHGFALILLGLYAEVFQDSKISFVMNAFWVGILLFSFNCYFYVLTEIKTFAMIVPLGGVLFTLGWFKFAWQIYKRKVN
jgi:uncharacterized membrane protein YgdD (TMEM256/DUF423 family)